MTEISLLDLILGSTNVAVAFGLSTLCGVLSTCLFYIARREINAKVPVEDAVRAFGATPGLYLRVYRLHRALYPQSRLRTWTILVIFLGSVSMIYVAWLLDII